VHLVPSGPSQHIEIWQLDTPGSTWNGVLRNYVVVVFFFYALEFYRACRDALGLSWGSISWCIHDFMTSSRCSQYKMCHDGLFQSGILVHSLCSKTYLSDLSCTCKLGKLGSCSGSHCQFLDIMGSLFWVKAIIFHPELRWIVGPFGDDFPDKPWWNSEGEQWGRNIIYPDCCIFVSSRLSFSGANNCRANVRLSPVFVLGYLQCWSFHVIWL